VSRKVWGDSAVKLLVATPEGADMLLDSFLSVSTISTLLSVDFLVECVIMQLLVYLGRSSG
jgi:hypothetical protein